MAECQPCYRAGHFCPATGEANTFPDGVAKCAFCEDDIECPKTRDARLLAERATSVREFSRPAKTSQPVKTSRAPKQSQPAASHETTATEEKTAMDNKCKCGCGELLSPKAMERGWEYNFGHRPEKAAVDAAPKKKAAKKQTSAQPAPAAKKSDGNGEDKTVATLLFTGQQLVRMFTMLPFEDQVMCMQAYVDRAI